MLEENKDDFKDSLIERKNLINTFKISEIETHLKTLKKVKAEGEGTMKIAQATADNVLRNNEFINSMSEEGLNAAFMYKENMDVVKEIEPQLEGVVEEIAKHEEYLDIIYDKFGFVKTNVPTEHGPEGTA